MHSILYAEPGKDGDASGLDCETPVKKVSVQSQLPSKFFNERVATPRVRCAFFDDEARPSLKPRSDHHTTETEVLVSASSSGNFQKPWPSRKVAEVEELVKYMSSVPCYLQRVKGVNVQGKALNFGVIDWRHLERWTSSKKTSQINEVSSAIKMAESPSLLTNQSCSNSGRSNSNSPAQRKQTPCRSSSSLPVEGKQTFSVVGHCDKPDEQKFCVSKHEDRTSTQAETSSSIEEEKSKSCDHQSSNHVRGYSGRTFERSLSEHGCDFDHLKGSRSVKGKTLSSMHGGETVMEVKKLPQRFFHQSSASRDILQSGFLSATVQTDKFNMGATALPIENGVPSTKYMSKNEECNQISKSSGNFLFSTVYQSCDQNADDISGGRRETMPKKHSSDSGMKWLNRSSSLKDVSSNHQYKDINSLVISDDKGRNNSRGRRSPLRRLLDPLLKSKNDGYSGPITSSPIPRSQENHNNRSVSAGKESSSLNSMHRLSDSSNTQIPITPQSLLLDERNVAPMRQALVKLAWKNGQPLFMFSTSENSVLLASLKRTNRLGKVDSSGVYKIVMAQESKKKGGIWIGHSGSRKPNLVYDVVGRLEVSCSKLCSFDSKSFEISKQFVLINEELLPNQGCVNSTHTNQLIAIVVKAPSQKLNGFLYKRSSLQIDSLQVEKFPEYSRACSISAIIPSGIHGFSDLGTPSALIERWKTGGSCDCGGWDEGCRLTVLADRLHEMKVASSVQERPTAECFRSIELFIQGGKKEKKHAFSMIAFKEGLYTVEFGSMITSLQAFAICIATLHSRTSIDALDYSAKRRSLEDALYENYSKMNSMQNNGGSTSYEPHHPPFSPVGRS